jgi:hypothetical protein
MSNSISRLIHFGCSQKNPLDLGVAYCNSLLSPLETWTDGCRLMSLAWLKALPKEQSPGCTSCRYCRIYLNWSLPLCLAGLGKDFAEAMS